MKRSYHDPAHLVMREGPERVCVPCGVRSGDDGQPVPPAPPAALPIPPRLRALLECIAPEPAILEEQDAALLGLDDAALDRLATQAAA